MQSITAFAPRQSENVHKHRKESTFRRELALIDLDDGECVVTVRWYGAGQRSYCCLWFGRTGSHARGSDYAGGGGYHKDSAAMQGALEAAGVTLAEPINGRGSIAEREALEALARWFDVARPLVHSAHP